MSYEDDITKSLEHAGRVTRSKSMAIDLAADKPTARAKRPAPIDRVENEAKRSSRMKIHQVSNMPGADPADTVASTSGPQPVTNTTEEEDDDFDDEELERVDYELPGSDPPALVDDVRENDEVVENHSASVTVEPTKTKGKAKQARVKSVTPDNSELPLSFLKTFSFSVIVFLLSLLRYGMISLSSPNQDIFHPFLFHYCPMVFRFLCSVLKPAFLNVVRPHIVPGFCLD